MLFIYITTAVVFFFAGLCVGALLFIKTPEDPFDWEDDYKD